MKNYFIKLSVYGMNETKLWRKLLKDFNPKGELEQIGHSYDSQLIGKFIFEKEADNYERIREYVKEITRSVWTTIDTVVPIKFKVYCHAFNISCMDSDLDKAPQNIEEDFVLGG